MSTDHEQRDVRKWPFVSYGDYVTSQVGRARSSRGLTHRRAGLRRWLVGRIRHYCPEARSLLCLGARDSSEVEDFCQAGFEAEGIDLYEEGLIQQCDMSDLDGDPRFAGRQFDVFVSIHSLEHCLDFEQFQKRSLPHCRLLFAAALPVNNQLIPTEWDCTAYAFQRSDSDSGDFERAFPGFQLEYRHIHRGQVIFLLVRHHEDVP